MHESQIEIDVGEAAKFKCRQCGAVLPMDERSPGKPVCRPCRKAWLDDYRVKNAEKLLMQTRKYAREHSEERKVWKKEDKRRRLAHNLCKYAMQRAKKNGLPFSIEPEDLEPVPTHCPVLGIPLSVNEKFVGPNSFTIDRKVPELGYVPGNVCIISHRANSIKNNATLAELLRVAQYTWTCADAKDAGQVKQFSFQLDDGTPAFSTETAGNRDTNVA